MATESKGLDSAAREELVTTLWFSWEKTYS